MRELAGAQYHRARAAMEMERAAQAADPNTAALHRELAELHLRQAAIIEQELGPGLSLAHAEGTAGR